MGFTNAALHWMPLTDFRNGVKGCPHQPALTASIRVRCTSDSRHASRGRADLRSVPHPDMGCSLALQRVKGCGTPEVNIALGNWLAMQEACLLETKAAD